MPRVAVLTAIALLLIAVSVPGTASAADNPNCRAGTTLAVVAGKATCLKARMRCKRKLDRQYKAHGFRCRKPKRRPRLSLGNAALRRGGAAVPSRPNGSITTSTALQAVERAIGPMPGVRVRRGAIGRLTSGTGPLRWLEAKRSRISAKQRAALDRYRAELFPEVTASSADLATARGYLDDALGRIGGHLGESLGHPATLSFGAADGTAFAVTVTVRETGPDGKTRSHCKVSVTPAGRKLSDNELHSSLSHEAFHCFQDKWNATAYNDTTKWLYEGSANWAAKLLDAERGYSSTVLKDWWRSWLLSPEATLYSRDYNAMGFFAHMHANGLSMWGNIRDMIKVAPDNARAYGMATSGVAGDRTVDTWAPAYHRLPPKYPGWNFSGPDIPPDDPGTPAASLGNGGTVKVASLARAVGMQRIALKSEVMVVSGDARGRLTDVDADQRPLSDGEYCTKPGGCVCPDGRPGPPDALSTAIRVGVSGHNSVSGVKFKGRSLKDWCKKAPPGGRLTISGLLSGTATGVGTCSVSGDDLTVIIATDVSPRRYLQMDTGHYGGVGSYAATGRGVTSGPRVSVTDGMGTVFATEYQPEGGGAGGFSVSSDTATQMRGSVAANMFGPGGSSGAAASGTWVCDKI